MSTSPSLTPPVSGLEYQPNDTSEIKLCGPEEFTLVKRLESQSNSLRIERSGRKEGLSFKLLVPTLVVVLVTAGIGAALLIWLLVYKTQPSISKVWQDGAFLLDEGTHTEGGLEAARLMGLTFSSAAVIALGITTPFLMSLYAFRTARVWLAAKDSNLPTPLQYGLLVNLLASSGLMSLLNTGNYLLRGQKKQSHVARILNEALVVAVVAYVLTHAVSVADLWLHTTASTVHEPTETPTASFSQFSVAQNTCLPYPDPWYLAIHPCLFSEGVWGNGIESRTPGMLVSTNSSDVLKVITIANASDLAVAVDTRPAQNIAFRATTFGARASCLSANQLCGSLDNYQQNSSCPGFPAMFPPVNSTPLATTGLSQGESKVFIQSSNCHGCPYIDARDMTRDEAALDTTLPPPENAYSMWMQFLWQSEGDTPYGTPPPGNDAVFGYSNLATMLVNCTLSFYNVTLDYKNSSYNVVDEILSNTGLSDGLAGPARVGQIASHLISNIEGTVFSRNDTNAVMAFLNQDLARLALGAAAVITNLRGPTLSQSVLSERILGRYPFWPTVILIILLFVNAVFALIIFVAAALSRADRIIVPGNAKSVSALELAQLRLTSPVALAAELFPAKDNDTGERRADLSAKTSAMAMFEEGDDERVKVGLYECGKSRRAVFGLWRRVSSNSEKVPADSMGEDDSASGE